MAAAADSAPDEDFDCCAIGLALTSTCSLSPISRRGRTVAPAGLLAGKTFFFLLDRVLSRGFMTVPLRCFGTMHFVSVGCEDYSRGSAPSKRDLFCFAYLNMQQTGNIVTCGVIYIRTRRHLPFAGKFSESKVVKLPLKRTELRMSKVFVEDFPLQFAWIMHFNASFVFQSRNRQM